MFIELLKEGLALYGDVVLTLEADNAHPSYTRGEFQLSIPRKGHYSRLARALRKLAKTHRVSWNFLGTEGDHVLVNICCYERDAQEVANAIL